MRLNTLVNIISLFSIGLAHRRNWIFIYFSSVITFGIIYNSSNCFLTERKAQPDECFLCSSLEKATHEHVNRENSGKGRKATVCYHQPPPHLTDTHCSASGAEGEVWSGRNQGQDPHSHTTCLSTFLLCGLPPAPPISCGWCSLPGLL